MPKRLSILHRSLTGLLTHGSRVTRGEPVARQPRPALSPHHRPVQKLASSQAEQGRLECSHIDRHRCARVSNRFGQEAFLANVKVARQHIRVLIEASDPALSVLKHDEVKLACRSASSNLGDPLEHPHGLERRWSDAPTNIADHNRLSETQAEHVSRIDALIHTANDHGPWHQGYILRELMGSEALVPF